MTNYRAYLKGKSFGTDPLRQELKLKAAKHSGDPKKIVEALSQLLRVEVAPPGSCIRRAKRSLASST
jgi:hypothetical protein